MRRGKKLPACSRPDYTPRDPRKPYVMPPSLVFFGLGVLAVGAALYFGRIPVDVAPLTAFLSAYLSPPQAATPPPPAAVPVTVAAVKKETVPILLSGIGTVQAYNTVSVRSRVDGELTQ